MKCKGALTKVAAFNVSSSAAIHVASIAALVAFHASSAAFNVSSSAAIQDPLALDAAILDRRVQCVRRSRRSCIAAFNAYVDRGDP